MTTNQAVTLFVIMFYLSGHFISCHFYLLAILCVLLFHKCIFISFVLTIILCLYLIMMCYFLVILSSFFKIVLCFTLVIFLCLCHVAPFNVAP